MDPKATNFKEVKGGEGGMERFNSVESDRTVHDFSISG